jgi:1-acyl-sn-glycerol-3-phosphate acyltransferase
MPDVVARALHGAFRRMLRRGLRGVWLRGELPDGPFVWAANHHSWWDPFLAGAILDGVGRSASLVMRQDNLDRFGFVRRVGVFGTAEPRRGLTGLAAGRVLVIFPEQELRPAGPPGPMAAGAAWYACRAGVPLCAVATRVVLRGHDAPEAYLRLSTVDTPGSVRETTARLADRLTHELADLDAWIGAVDPRTPLPGYRLAMPGRRSWDERLSRTRPW